MKRFLLRPVLIYLAVIVFVLAARFAAHAITPFGTDMLTQGPGGSGVGGACVPSLNFTQSCSIPLWGSLQ